MPHLHLPIDHTDADLVLAANLADIVGSEDLYVAWSHGSGPGAVPQVQAVVCTEREMSPMAEVLGAVGAGVAAFWRALMGRPKPAAPAAPAADAPRPAAERPYADS
jgi:hypothetical protein